MRIRILVIIGLALALGLLGPEIHSIVPAAASNSSNTNCVDFTEYNPSSVNSGSPSSWPLNQAVQLSASIVFNNTPNGQCQLGGTGSGSPPTEIQVGCISGCGTNPVYPLGTCPGCQSNFQAVNLVSGYLNYNWPATSGGGVTGTSAYSNAAVFGVVWVVWSFIVKPGQVYLYDCGGDINHNTGPPCTSQAVYGMLGQLPLSAGFSYTAANPLGSVPIITLEQVTFTGSCINGSPPCNYDWNFGDGTTANGQTATHSYSAPGNYNAQVTATDTMGTTASATRPIYVSSPPTLNDFWGGAAYFERSHYTTSNGGSDDFQELAPLVNPYGNTPNSIFVYFRHNVNNHGEIFLSYSNDGGATYSPANLGNPVLCPGIGTWIPGSPCFPSQPCAWDANNVIMPSVVKVGLTFFMVYEGDSIFANNCPGYTIGDIGLATSADGVTWNKFNGDGQFLKHDTNTADTGYDWQCNNIGGPSVNYFNGQFYVFFHGNCGAKTDSATFAVCNTVLGSISQLARTLICQNGAVPCTPPLQGVDTSSCPRAFRFDNLRNKAGMVHAAGTDLTTLQSTLQSSINGGNPIMGIGVGIYSWDARVDGRPNVIYEGGYYYLFFEGADYAYLVTYDASLPVIGGLGHNEGNWGWGVARTLDINNGPWEKYAYNPVRQDFQNSNSGLFQQPYVFQVNGVTWVYMWHPGGVGQSSVLVWGTDSYLHVYPAVNVLNGQCEKYHSTNPSIGYPDGDGWAQTTQYPNGNQVPNGYLCYGPYQGFTNSNDYSTSLWTTWYPGSGNLPAGNYAVTYRNMIDSTSCANDGLSCAPIATLDVTHNSGINQDAKIVPSRNDYQANYAYQDFETQFTATTTNQPYEWRTFFDSHAYLRAYGVVLRQIDGTYDNTAPTASMNGLPGNSGRSISVSWNGNDAQTGIWSFDVQYNNGAGWQNWQMGTTSTSATLSGAQCFSTYSFIVRARDFAGNLGGYSSPVSTYIACDFSVSASPTSLTVIAQTPATSTITVSPINGYPDTVNLSADNGCSLSPSSVVASGTSTLSCIFSTYGTYTVTVTASGDGLSHQATVAFTVQDFTMSSSPNSLTIPTGSPGTSTISVGALNGFAGIVSLTASVSPTGLTCTLTPTTVTGSGPSTLQCNGSVGIYNVIVTGTSGFLSHNAPVTVTVQDFSISPSSTTVPALVGQTATATLSVASLNGFAGTVSLSDTPLPSGLTCNSISPSSITLPPSSASATLSCSATIVGTYTVTILASSGSLSHTATVTFTVQDYTISISPTSETIIGSNTGASTVTITPVNGFANIVSLTASPSPSGLYCYFSPNTITGSGTATMYCYGSAGTYTVTITGAVGTFTHFATATITVRDFLISASPSSISIPDGRSGSVTVQATSLNGYTGTIVLGVSNLYCGTQSFSKPSIWLTSAGSNTSILTLNIGSNCNASQYSAYVTGYDSSAQVSRVGSLIVNTSDFSIVGQVGTTVGIGGQTTLKYNVTYYDNNNYPGSILTQTNSFGVNNCCLSTTIPTTFSITRPDSNSAPGLVTSLNIQTQSFSDPWNGQGFYAQGRDWIFFIYYGTCSGTTTNCLYYATSTNGAAWTIYNTGLVTGSTPSIVTNGTAVFYIRYNGVDTQSGKALMLGLGNLHTDGTIAWQPEKTVKPATSGVFWYAMSMRVSTTGQVFVAYNKLTSAYGSGYPYVIHSNGVDYTTWQQDTSLINSNDDWRFSIVPLSNGQMYILYWPYWGGLNGRLWSNGAWGSQVTITPSNTYVQQTAFGFSNGNSTVYAVWQERTSQKIQFATRTSSWSAPQTIFTADTGSNPRWTASYDPLHAKWYVLYYSYSTNQIWEYSGQPGSWSAKTILYTTSGASSNTMIGSFYNSGQVNGSTNTLGIFWTQYDSSLTTLQLKYANATIFTGGSFPSTWPITSTGAGSGATTLTVTASDGYITRSLTLQLTINGYNVTYYYNPLPVNQGSSTAIYLQIFPEYGIPLTQATVSPVTVPSCITVSPPNPQFFNIGPIGGYDFPTVPVAASSTCTVGNYQVTVKITGTSVHTYDKLLTFTVVVATPPPGGGGGGSVAAGTLITLADGSQVPVQSLKVGMHLLSYDMATHQYVVTTITKFVTVMTYNQMVISTSTGKPLIVDQNPAQRLYVKLPDGTVTLMSVTDLKVGYSLFDAVSQTWVPITSIHYQNGGQHLMYDIYTSSPGNYIANGYLDPLKT